MQKTQLKAVFRKFVKKYSGNPGLFVREIIGAEPTPQQEELLAAFGKPEMKRIAVRSGHGCGKDASAAWLIIYFLCCFPLSKVVCTAPTYRQLFDILKTETVYWLNKSLVCRLFEVQSDRIFIRGYKETWWCRFVSVSAKDSPEEQAETLAGYHADNFLAIVDEASGVPDPVFLPIEGFLTRKNNKVLLISNPTKTKGYFYRVFNDPAERKLWHLLHWDSEESPIVSRDWIDGYRRKYGEGHPVYRVRVKGEFPPAGGDTLIPLEWAQQCVGFHFQDISEEDPALPVVCGLDVARFGEDRTVLTTVVGPYVKTQKVTWHLSTDAVADWVMAKLDEMQLLDRLVYLFVDVTGGLGAGPADLLRRWLGRRVVDVNVSWKAFDDTAFFSLRDELWWRARTACEKIAWSLPDDMELVDELCLPSYKQDDRTGKIKVQSKRELKAKGLGSPDKADSLNLTRYFAVPRTARITRPKRRRNFVRSWKVA